LSGIDPIHFNNAAVTSREQSLAKVAGTGCEGTGCWVVAGSASKASRDWRVVVGAVVGAGSASKASWDWRVVVGAVVGAGAVVVACGAGALLVVVGDGAVVIVAVGAVVDAVATALATVKSARRLEVVPSDHVSTARMLCNPSASLVVL